MTKADQLYMETPRGDTKRKRVTKASGKSGGPLPEAAADCRGGTIMRWIEKIRQILQHTEAKSGPVSAPVTNAADAVVSAPTAGAAPQSRSESAEWMAPDAAEAPRAETAAGRPKVRPEVPLHTQPCVEMPAQKRYGQFRVSFDNNPVEDSYEHTVEGTYNELLYCALVILEYMGHQDEARVMDACARLVQAAKAYHQKQRIRVNHNARVLFTSSDMTGVLDRDFL